MPTELKSALIAALAGSSSQQPVNVDALYKIGARKKVEAALTEMYRQQEVGCCLITKRCDLQYSVWWLSAAAAASHSFGRTGRSAAA